MVALDKVSYTTHEPSYFDNTVHGKMRRVALDGAGLVMGVHHPDNTNLWEDETEVDWALYESNNWNCMVQIPKFYYKVEFGEYGTFTDVYRASVSEIQEDGYKLHPAFERDGVIKDYQYMSAFEGWIDARGALRSLPNKTVTASKTRAQFRTAALLNGDDYRQQEFYLTSAIQMLFITEFADMNSQRALGLGRATGEPSYLATGLSLTNGNHSYGNKTVNSEHMSYRGIENFWGNYWKTLDGLNINNYIPYVSKSAFTDDVFVGNYKRLGTTQTLPTGIPQGGGYIKNFHKIEGDSDFTFIPSTVGGSSSTYLSDGAWTTTGNRIAAFGGDTEANLFCGVFCLHLYYAASNSFPRLASRLLYI